MTRGGENGEGSRFPGLIRTAVFLVAAVGVFSLCGPGTEAEKFHRYLESLVQRAESGDLEGIMIRLAPEYLDFEGRDKGAARNLVAGYLENRRRIVIHLLTAKLERSEPAGRTDARVEIMLSSGPAEALRRFVTLAGDFYRFEFGLIEDAREGWLIRSASWEHLGADELLPESLAAARKLFSRK